MQEIGHRNPKFRQDIGEFRACLAPFPMKFRHGGSIFQGYLPSKDVEQIFCRGESDDARWEKEKPLSAFAHDPHTKFSRMVVL